MVRCSDWDLSVSAWVQMMILGAIFGGQEYRIESYAVTPIACLESTQMTRWTVSVKSRLLLLKVFYETELGRG